MSEVDPVRQLLELLRHYQAFLEENPTGDLADLGYFLIAQGGGKPEQWQGDFSDASGQEEVEAGGEDVVLGYLMARLGAYVDVWVKEAFRDLPLVSQGDFGILKTVEQLGNPTKKDIFEAVILERTTCNESIKRLTKKGLFRVTTDPEDRRLRRVSLTAEGAAIAQEATRKMAALTDLMVGPIPPHAKVDTHERLKQLTDYHAGLYAAEREEIRKRFGL